MKVIARIHTDFPTKFGIPRQSGIVPALRGKIVFEPDFRAAEAVRGLDKFSHIWVIWEFSENKNENRDGEWSPTVRPPRLGGNARVGVFATRSPYRPNPIGLSCLKLDSVSFDDGLGPVLNVSGVDLMDNTPIYDIKPYIPYADCKYDANEEFTGYTQKKTLNVTIPLKIFKVIADPEKKETLLSVLSQDPRPAYQDDPDRIYGLLFGGYEIKFCVNGENLTVTEIIPVS